MKYLNKFRLMAGIPIDPSIEVTEKRLPVAESAPLLEGSAGSAIDDFWTVGKAAASSELKDVLRRTNAKGLIHQIAGGSQDKDFEDTFLIFAGADKHFASREAKKRIRDASNASIEAEEEMFFRKAEIEAEEEMEYEEATKLADKDYDGDGTIETSAEEHKGVRNKAIKAAIRANQHEEEEWTKEDFDYVAAETAKHKPEKDWEPTLSSCPKCEGGECAPKDGKCKVCDGTGEIFESYEYSIVTESGKAGTFHTTRGDLVAGQIVSVNGADVEIIESMHTYKKANYDSWEDDEEEPTNIAGDAKKVKGIPDEVQVKAGADDPRSHDAPKQDKDESPTQLKALDTPSQQDQSGGGDQDRALVVPARYKTMLKDEATQARSEAKKLSVTDRDASYFYEDLARMYDDLRTHLEGGTVYDLKQAQIFMTSLMGPMLHKIPRDVVNFIAKGGETRSLKSYMTKVDTKYPITGPRNAL